MEELLHAEDLSFEEAMQVNDVKARLQNFLSNNRLVLCIDLDGAYIATTSNSDDGTLLLARIELNDVESL